MSNTDSINVSQFCDMYGFGKVDRFAALKRFPTKKMSEAKWYEFLKKEGFTISIPLRVKSVSAPTQSKQTAPAVNDKKENDKKDQ